MRRRTISPASRPASNVAIAEEKPCIQAIKIKKVNVEVDYKPCVQATNTNTSIVLFPSYEQIEVVGLMRLQSRTSK